LAAARVKRLRLNGLTTLSADAARALAGFQGPLLHLDGLTTLSAESAAALAGFEGKWLYLNGLTTLPADAGAMFAKFKGKGLFVRGLTALRPDAARGLAACTAWDGQLPGIAAFEAADSVQVAAALADRQGRLLLPNLKRISPKTLQALIRKEDVQIPSLDELELIPEPDGGPTEDFVIPEGFLERQRRR
jgi:hypothetical protein